MHAITCSPLVCFYLLRTLARNKSHRKSLLMNECWGIFSQAYKDGYIFSHLAGSMLRLRGSFSFFFLNLHKDLRSMSVYHKHYFYMTRHKGNYLRRHILIQFFVLSLVSSKRYQVHYQDVEKNSNVHLDLPKMELNNFTLYIVAIHRTRAFVRLQLQCL